MKGSGNATEHCSAMFHKGYLTFQHWLLCDWALSPLLSGPLAAMLLVKQTKTDKQKPLWSVKAAGLLDTHQRSPSKVQKTEHSTNSEPGHTQLSNGDGKGGGPPHSIFLDAMSLDYQKDIELPNTPTAVHNSEPSLRPKCGDRPRQSLAKVTVSIRNSLRKVSVTLQLWLRW